MPERFKVIYKGKTDLDRYSMVAIAIPFEIETVVRASRPREQDARTTAFPKSFRIAIYADILRASRSKYMRELLDDAGKF